MYHLLKNNQKKILTIFAAGLMVVFIIPPAVSHFGGQRDIVDGHIGTEKVMGQSVRNARQEWELLKSNIFIVGMFGGRPQLMPLAQTLGLDAFKQIDNHREMFYLLQFEARKMGVQVSVDRLDSLLEQRIYVLDQEHKPVQYSKLRDPDLKDAVHATVADFMLVQNAAERASDVMKVSLPMRQRAMASQFQSLTLKLADFNAEDLLKKVPAPTEKQIQSLFDRYANTPAGAYSDSDPLGFGYRYPDRIKIQYIKLSWADLRSAAMSVHDQYEWKVEAYKQYQAHPERFKLPPTTQPTTRAGATATTQASASTKPAIEPFDQVFDEIRDNLVDSAAKAMQGKIRSNLEARLQKDFDTWEAAQASTRPADAASSLGAPYGSFQYLHALADHVQKQYHVRLSVVDIDKYLDSKALGELTGIGGTHTLIDQAAGDDNSGAPQTASFADYAMNDAAPLLPNQGKDNPAALQLNKLSMAMTDPTDDVYYFRITAAQPAHRPDDVSEVRSQVENDVRVEEAYNRMKQNAQAFLEAAGKEGLERAAKSQGLKLLTVGPVTAQPGSPIENYSLPAVAHGEFVKEAFNLLGQKAAGKSNPIELIPLPAGRRLAVAQLESVKAEWSPQTKVGYELITAMELGRQLRQPLLDDWFNFDHLVDRVHFVAASQDQS